MRRCLNCMNEYPDECQDICPHCGYVDGKTQDGAVYLTPGSILQGRYIVGTVITARDIDVIYHGWDALFDRRVRIQEYFPKYCCTRSGKPEVSIYDAKQERYEQGLELFCRQSRELLRLYKEDGVVTYHACFVENKTAYAIMDDRTDKTLAEVLDGQTMKVKEALAYLSAVIETVEQCHRIGVYHGLISTETFWVTGDKRLILKDFGAWRYLSGEPGIVDYGKAGVHTDVYRIARLFCRMITGKEIEDGEKLETELLKRSISLSGSMTAAIKHALSHDTKSLAQFRRELYGKNIKRKENAGSRLKQQRKNDRSSLVLPRWAVWGAASAVIFMLVFTALLATGAIQMKIRSEEGRQVPGRMPNLLSYDVEEAASELQKMGLELNLVADKMEFDNEVPEGRICYQSPKEASIIKPGDTVTIYISKGKEKEPLPSLLGVTKEEAMAMLSEAGFLNVSAIDDKNADGAYGTVVKIEVQEQPELEQGKEPEGIVGKIISWVTKSAKEEPEAVMRPLDGESVLLPLDTEITLVICMKENVTSAAKEVVVPTVTGMEKAAVGEVLEKLGLLANWIEETDEMPAGTVIGQDPEAGETVAAGAYITVRVSKGIEKIYMKNVALMTEEEARAEIAELGLSVGEIEKQYSDTAAAGKVISQSIVQDTEVKKGETVNLVISLGAKPKADSGTKQDDKGTGKTAAPKKTIPRETSKQQTESKEEPVQQVESKAEEIANEKEEREKANEASEKTEATSASQTATDAAATNGSSGMITSGETKGGGPGVKEESETPTIIQSFPESPTSDPTN